jgi:hypothetical protein
MEHVITPDHFCLWISQHREGKTHALGVLAIDLRRIGTDSSQKDAAGLEIAEPLLETP